MLLQTRRSAAFCAILTVAFSIPGAAWGQASFKVDSVAPPELTDAKSTLHRELKLARNRCVTSASLSDDDRAKGQRWFKEYILPSMTQTADLGRVSELRREVTTDLSRVKNSEFHDMLVSDAETHAKKVLGDKGYHPFVRVTGMFLLGYLNSIEASPSGQKVPTPYGPAMDVMLEKLQAADEIDGVKVAALCGIRRHVSTYWAPDGRTISNLDLQRITTAMMALVQAATPPENRSPAGHAWMRGQAIEVLAAMGQPGEKREVYNAIDAVLSNQEAPTSLRCIAAKSLGLLQYPTDFAAKDAEVFGKSAISIGQVAVLATERELDRFKAMKEKLKENRNSSSTTGSGVGGLGGGGLGGGGLGGGGLGGPGGPGGLGGPGLGGGTASPPGGAGGLGGLGGPGGPGGLGGVGGGPGGLGGGGLGGGGLGGGGLGGLSPGAPGPKYPQHAIDNMIRRLKHEVLCLQTGIQGTAGSSKTFTGLEGMALVAEEAKIVGDVKAGLQGILDTTSSESDADALFAELRTKLRTLKDVVGTGEAASDDPLAPKPATAPGTDPLSGAAAPADPLSGAAAPDTAKKPGEGDIP